VAMVDRVKECEPGKRIVALKNVSANEPQFQGHFPGRPIMPGVIMVEALAQAGAVAVLSHEENRGKLALFAGIDDVRFKRIVSPGDELILTCEVEDARRRVGRGRATATVGDDVAVRGLLTFASR
jgi:3-hydroxyacyl-[acyl-carrier-protein] dehydratase